MRENYCFSAKSTRDIEMVAEMKELCRRKDYGFSALVLKLLKDNRDKIFEDLNSRKDDYIYLHRQRLAKERKDD